MYPIDCNVHVAIDVNVSGNIERAVMTVREKIVRARLVNANQPQAEVQTSADGGRSGRGRASH